VLESVESFDQVLLGLGDRFEDDLFSCFNRIKSDPDLFAVNPHGFRAAKLKRFQAVVYFQIQIDSIVIFRVCVNGRADGDIEGVG